MFSRARLKFRVGGGRNLFHHRNSRPAQTLRVFPTRELGGGRQLPTVLCEPKVFLVSWSKDLFFASVQNRMRQGEQDQFFFERMVVPKTATVKQVATSSGLTLGLSPITKRKKKSEINYSASPLKPSSFTCWSCRFFFVQSNFFSICLSTYKYVCFPFQFTRVSAFFF